MAKGKDAVSSAIYLRLSQDRDGDALGIERQETICRRLVEDRGWSVGEVYVDRDLSAYTKKRRPAFEAMLDDIRIGLRDAIVVVDQDRLTRRMSELTALLDELDTLKVAIVMASGELDTSTADGRLRAQILGSVAEHESKRKSERIRRQRDQAAHLGVPHGGQRPFGYEPDGMTLRVEEADAIRDAAERVLRGESLSSICRDWNTRGLATARGRVWKTHLLRNVLIGPRIAGLRRHHGDIVGDATWPAIIPRSTHEKLVAVMNGHRSPGPGRPPTRLLTSILRCGRCGSRMTAAARTGGTRRYICAAGPGKPGCGHCGILAEPVEALVVEMVMQRVESAAFAKAVSRQRGLVADDPSERVVDAERRLEELAESWAAGEITRAEWLAARQFLVKQTESARKELSREGPDGVALQYAGRSGLLRTSWEGMTIEEQRAVIAAVLERVVVAPVEGRATKFDPDRLDPIWRA